MNIPRSIRLSQKGLLKVEQAFFLTGMSQNDFAKSCELGRSTFTQFLAGKPILRENFFKFCKALDLNPLQVMLPTNQTLENLRNNIQPHFIGLSSLQEENPISFNNWLRGIYEPDWQSITSIFGSNLKFNIRSKWDAHRGQIINLNKLSLILLIGLKHQSNNGIKIIIQLHPGNNEPNLPSNIKLVLLSECHEKLRESRSKNNINFIQLPLIELLRGDLFILQVISHNFSFTQSFAF